MSQNISQFIREHYRHFNAAVLRDAAQGYCDLLDGGGRMLMTLAGAMSTGELGISLGEMIRQGKVHAICCTGANLEEDLINLIGHEEYLPIPHYRDLTTADECSLLKKGFNRVTDTGIPERAFKRLEAGIVKLWKSANSKGESRFPYEYLYALIREGSLKDYYQADPRNSWLVAACEKDLPVFVPGWEDSTMGNVFAAQCHMKVLSPSVVRSGIEAMVSLIDWYRRTAKQAPIGFFQIGGGIAGDFPICVVPTIRIDLKEDTPLWAYFCQISDSTTSYGSYSGAVPNEKITWEKLGPDTPRFVIESDASIVAPLVFAYVLGW